MKSPCICSMGKSLHEHLEHTRGGVHFRCEKGERTGVTTRRTTEADCIIRRNRVLLGRGFSIRGNGVGGPSECHVRTAVHGVRAYPNGTGGRIRRPHSQRQDLRDHVRIRFVEPTRRRLERLGVTDDLLVRYYNVRYCEHGEAMFLEEAVKAREHWDQYVYTTKYNLNNDPNCMNDFGFYADDAKLPHDPKEGIWAEVPKWYEGNRGKARRIGILVCDPQNQTRREAQPAVED